MSHFQENNTIAIAELLRNKVKEEGLKAALNKIVDKGTEKTALEKHLRAYTQRNTTDYFLHKDLKDPLRGNWIFI
jgi:adenine-specific DNA-methyltransferase